MNKMACCFHGQVNDIKIFNFNEATNAILTLPYINEDLVCFAKESNISSNLLQFEANESETE